MPGSKSIANRVLLLAALATGTSTINNVPIVSEDVRLMLDALINLGVEINFYHENDEHTATTVKIVGTAGQFLAATPDTEIFCGNSGTSMRFLAAALAVMPHEYILTGIARMKERPIADLLIPLRKLGSTISCLEQEGYPPIRVGKFIDSKLTQIELNPQVSSQYVTAMLMALAILKRPIRLQLTRQPISIPYIEITQALLKYFGCHIQAHEHTYLVADTGLTAINYTIEPDASSASYFLALGALIGDITVNNLDAHSLQGDKEFARVLASMGAEVHYGNGYIRAKTAHHLLARPRFKAINLNMQAMPDVAMTIAVLCLCADGTSTITGIRSWQVKETNRVTAMATELSKLGAQIKFTDDSISITPPLSGRLNAGIHIDTYNDHRMAMCFSLVAAMGVNVIINDHHCVAKTFANYFTLFQQLSY